METLSAIKLEEMARAVIAEAIYRKKEELMKDMHTLEGENLELKSVDNQQRDLETTQGSTRKTSKKKKRGGGDRLSRELKRISYQ